MLKTSRRAKRMAAFECLTTAEDSHRERKKIERNTRAKRERTREKRTKKEKKALSLLCFCSLLLFLSLSLSLSLVFFFWLCFLSLEVFLSLRSVSRFPLSRNSDESARGFQRAPLCCSETRALQREKREREREREETRERARAQANTLYRRKFLSFALSLRHYREELTTTRKTEYSFLSCTRKTENSHVFPGKPSS